MTGGGPPSEAEGLWTEVGRIAFRFLFGAICVVAIGWAFSNVRQISPHSRAVVLRFGGVIGEHGPGLLLAWPRPIEQVIILPGRDQQVEFKVDSEGDLLSSKGSLEVDVSQEPRQNAGFLLTGDSGVVSLRMTVFYQITDATAYVLSAEHVRPALRRLFAASAVAVSASHDLDQVLVTGQDSDIAGDGARRISRERLRADLVSAVNRRLARLAAEGTGLGITVSRVDLTASLPRTTKAAFDQVLVATQTANREIAAARADAARSLQSAAQERDRILTEAEALAAERRTEATARTATIAALDMQLADSAGPVLISRIYYDRVGPLLKKAARLDTFDVRSGAQLLLPGQSQ
jgi:regulator of protease activity HflC (stomatin/prohibitin superfamily)